MTRWERSGSPTRTSAGPPGFGRCFAIRVRESPGPSEISRYASAVLKKGWSVVKSLAQDTGWSLEGFSSFGCKSQCARSCRVSREGESRQNAKDAKTKDVDDTSLD